MAVRVEVSTVVDRAVADVWKISDAAQLGISVRHRYRSHYRPGAEAGPESETHLPEPSWDTRAELSHETRQLSVGRGRLEPPTGGL
jgi:hypothetical protein